MSNGNNIDLILTLQQLLDSKAINKDNDVRSKVLSEKIGKLLETIPQFIQYVNEDNKNFKHKFFIEFGRYIKYNKIQKGTTIQHVCEGDKLFYMIITGRILKLNIKYKNLYSSLKDYIKFLTKLHILNEKYLYNDCIKKNQNVFPISENIDITKYSDKIKFLDFKNEIKEIENMKEKVLLINNEEKIKRKLNINNILTLYNPDIEFGGKNHFLNEEMKFLISLPFFYVDKIIEPISFLGHLNKNRGIKQYSSYICLNNCDVFYLDKDDIQSGDNPIYNLINRKKSEIITNKLFKNHFLFQDTDITFLSKNYSKYFEIINITKGDFIIYQGNAYEGVYFVLNGMLQLKSNRSYNELNDLNYCILNNIDNKISKKENIHNFNDKKKANIINKLIHNPLFIKKSNQKKEINLGIYTNNEIIGLSDIYDKKTCIYNYSVQCLTNEAELFFVPKEIFASLITNQEIYDKIIALTQEKNKILKLKIQKYKDLFEFEFDRFLSPDKDEKNNINRNGFYNKVYNKNYIGNKSIINRLIFKNENRMLLENFNKLAKSKSATDITKDNNVIQNKYLDFTKQYNNYYKNSDMVSQSKNSFQNSLVLNNELTNDVIIFKRKNIQQLNNNSINKNEQQILSLNNNSNNNNKMIDSKNNKNDDNKSKTLNNFFNKDNINNKNIKKNNNKLIKSSSTECLGQLSENGRIKRNNEEIFHLYNNKIKHKRNNNGLKIPFIKEIKSKKMYFDLNKINYKFINDNKYFNLLNKKTNNYIDISPKKNCITINKENKNNV